MRADPKKTARKKISKIAKQEADKLIKRAEEESIKRVTEMFYPVYLLACKDELKISNEELEKVDRRASRYLEAIGDRLVTVDDIKDSLGVW